MSKGLKVKAAVLGAIIVASVVCMGGLLASLQDALSIEDANEEIRLEMEDLPNLLTNADSDEEQNEATFDAVYQSKAESVAFMANNNVGFEVTNAKMQEYCDLMKVDNILVVDRAGTVLAQAQETPADFSYQRYNELRTVFESGEPSASVQVEFAEAGRTLRYYAAAIDDETMVVVEQNPAVLDELDQETSSLESVLRTISVGQSGYVFAVSAQTYEVLYHPNAELVGTDALNAGIAVDNLEDGTCEWIEFDGERLYAGVTLADDAYYLTVVPESDIVSSRTITVGVILFVFFSVMATVALYGLFIAREDERRGYNPENYVKVGPLTFNKAVGGKAAILSFVGFLAVAVVAFYMQTLFALSSESVRGNEIVDDMQATIERVNDQADALTQISNERYLNKAEVAAYILERNPDLANRESLAELSDVLQVEYTYVFDQSGTAIASDSPYATFSLSEDPADQTYEFRQLLAGVDSLVQDPQADELTGELRQYVGVTLRDEHGLPNGFVELSVRAERLEAMLATVQLDSILDGVKVGAGGFAFAVDKADGTFAYFPDESLMGRPATQNGMTEAQLKGGYSDYVKVNGESYYVTSLETDGFYVYVAEPESALMTNRVPLTILTGVGGLICQLVVFLVVSFSLRRPGSELAREQAEPDDDGPRTMDVVMPSGRVAKTESAASRWLYRSFKWDEKTAEQRLLTVVKVLLSVFSIAVCLGVLFREQIFAPDSVFSYILAGGWERGLNVFAVTACIMIACVVQVLAMLARELLRLLSNVFGARGETMCRLISSFIKYACIIGMVYYCLMVIGIDTTTLLASAGILSIAISFGAKELVSDILSGLFIILEGEFRVGDIIQVASKTGTVVEIGIRTTKINDGSGNIIIIRNSQVSNVVNMTKELSYATCEVGIEYGESIERIENILEKEFPKIRRHLPAIVDGPFYKGIVSLADNSVNIRIVAQCTESARGQLERDLRREMKIIFDEYDVNIPFPQVVVHQPKEFLEATWLEQMRASRFNEEQKVASKDIGNEEESRGK